MNFHSIWNTSQSTSWKLHQFWLVECFCDFCLSEGIFHSPQRNQEFQPTTPDGSLEAKITCSVAYYMCYSQEHTLCLSTHSRFFLDGDFFQSIPSRGTSKPQKGKTLWSTADCELHYESGRENKRQRGTKDNGRVRIWQRPLNDFYTLQTLGADWQRLEMAYFVWGESLLTTEYWVGN